MLEEISSDFAHDKAIRVNQKLIDMDRFAEKGFIKSVIN